MKVVLLNDIKGLGKKGEIKEVKDGYAMNFLIPNEKAVIATAGNAKQAELEIKKQTETKKMEIEKAKKLASEIDDQEIVIKVKAQGEKLFGALTKKEIKKALEEKSLNISSGQIVLAKPIKIIGDFKIGIIWDNDIKATIKLKVTSES